MNVPITSLYAALTALLVIFLAYRVVKYRRSLRVGLGANDNRELQVAIRAHANTVEYSPLFLILLLLAEINQLPNAWLHMFGALFVLSRLGHGWGFTKTSGGYSRGRFYGTVITWLVIVALAVINLACYLGIILKQV